MEWLLPAPLPGVLAVGAFVFALLVAVFRLIGILPFNNIRLRGQKGATQGSSVGSFHQQDLLAVVNLVQLNFDNFTIRSLDGASDKGRLNGQFAMSAVD